MTGTTAIKPPSCQSFPAICLLFLLSCSPADLPELFDPGFIAITPPQLLPFVPVEIPIHGGRMVIDEHGRFHAGLEAKFETAPVFGTFNRSMQSVSIPAGYTQLQFNQFALSIRCPRPETHPLRATGLFIVRVHSPESADHDWVVFSQPLSCVGDTRDMAVASFTVELYRGTSIVVEFQEISDPRDPENFTTMEIQVNGQLK